MLNPHSQDTHNQVLSSKGCPARPNGVSLKVDNIMGIQIRFENTHLSIFIQLQGFPFSIMGVKLRSTEETLQKTGGK